MDSKIYKYPLLSDIVERTLYQEKTCIFSPKIQIGHFEPPRNVRILPKNPLYQTPRIFYFGVFLRDYFGVSSDTSALLFGRALGPSYYTDKSRVLPEGGVGMRSKKIAIFKQIFWQKRHVLSKRKRQAR